MIISIIVCTYNRPGALIAGLDSMVAAIAEIAPVPAEIIVVDNNSTDDTAARVRAWIKSCPFPAQYVFEPVPGVSRAKNTALKLAKGELLVMTDDDCRLDKNHLKDALRHDAQDNELVIRGGRVELGDADDLPLTIKTQTFRETRKLSDNSARHSNMNGFIIGCNFVMRRAVVDKLGAYDERFGPGTAIPAAEDTDYLCRAYLAGMPIDYVPDMVVYHHHGRRAKQGQPLFYNYMIACGALYAKYLFRHPNFCRPFWWDMKCWLLRRESSPEAPISYGKCTRYSLIGMALYIFMSAKLYTRK